MTSCPHCHARLGPQADEDERRRPIVRIPVLSSLVVPVAHALVEAPGDGYFTRRWVTRYASGAPWLEREDGTRAKLTTAEVAEVAPREWMLLLTHVSETR